MRRTEVLLFKWLMRRQVYNHSRQSLGNDVIGLYDQRIARMVARGVRI
jgi:hypothetical protein